MSHPWFRRVTRGTLLVALTLGFLASGAYAYWTVAGAGSGSGDTGTTGVVTLSPATPVSELRPGGSSAVTLTITNSNTSPLRVDSLALDPAFGSGGFDVDAGHSGCSVAALSYATQTNGGAGWTVPAKDGTVNGTLAVTLADALTMSASAANACQGASFTVYLTAGS